tara:strand:+ start:77 stop:277 length:201 start_codon:yes stop_codon:yes gene_type:complete
MSDQVAEMMQKIKESASKGVSSYSHIWGDTDGSRCSKCGDKDWMADAACSVSDNEHEYNKVLKDER